MVTTRYTNRATAARLDVVSGSPEALVKVEVPNWFRYRLGVGLLKRFLEAPRQRIAAPLLVDHRLSKDRLTMCRLRVEYLVRILEYRFIVALGLTMGHDAT